MMRSALKIQGHNLLGLLTYLLTWKRMDSRTVITMSCVGDAYVENKLDQRRGSPEASLSAPDHASGCRRLRRPTSANQPLGRLWSVSRPVFDIGDALPMSAPKEMRTVAAAK